MFKLTVTMMMIMMLSTTLVTNRQLCDARITFKLIVKCFGNYDPHDDPHDDDDDDAQHHRCHK